MCVRRIKSLEGVGVREEVKEFCSLGDMLDSKDGEERAERTWVVVATWMKYREEITVLLNNKTIPLTRQRNRI